MTIFNFRSRRRTDGRPCVLVVAANPHDRERTRVEAEMREIQNTLNPSGVDSGPFQVILAPSTRFRDLRKQMLFETPAIVHFAGHGDVDGLIFEDGVGAARPIAKHVLITFFQQFTPDLACVVLSACYTADLARDISKHVPFVIGVPQAIPDKVALEFSAVLYEAIAAGKSIDKAFNIATNAISVHDLPEECLPKLKSPKLRAIPKATSKTGRLERTAAADRLLTQAEQQSDIWSGYQRMAAGVDAYLSAFRVLAKEGSAQKVAEQRKFLTDFLHWYGSHEKAIAVGKKCFKIAESAGDAQEMAWTAIYPLAREYFHIGDLDTAWDWTNRGLALFRDSQIRDGEAASLRYQGRIYEARGCLDEARESYDDAIRSLPPAGRIARDDGVSNLRAHLIAAIGWIDLQEGQCGNAIKAFERALRIYTQVGDKVGIAWMHAQLGRAASMAGDYPKARGLLLRAERAILQAEAPVKVAEIRMLLGDALAHLGDLPAARSALDGALQIYQIIDDTTGQLEAQGKIEGLTSGSRST